MNTKIKILILILLKAKLLQNSIKRSIDKALRMGIYLDPEEYYLSG